MLTANDPNTWLGILSASIGFYLSNQQPREALADDYRQFRDTFADSGLRKILPEPPKQKGRR